MPVKRRNRTAPNASTGGFKPYEDGSVFNADDAAKLAKMRAADQDAFTDNEKKSKKALEDREKAQTKLNKAEERSLTTRKQLNKSLEETTTKVRQSLNPFNQLAHQVEAVGKRMSDGADSIANFLNPLNLLSNAIDGVVALYENWFRLTNLMVGAQGRFAMATGATGAQLAAFRQEVSGLRDTFTQLVGSVDGITESATFLQENLLALRRSSTEGISEEFGRDLLFAERNLGMAATAAADLWRNIDAGTMGSALSVEEFGRHIMDFADTIGANAATISNEWNENRSVLALFGDQAQTTFEDAATYANHFGIETSRVLAMTTRFNSFGTAASQVNQFNAVFGTTLSSMELMLETDPTRRMDMITAAARSTGSTWASMAPTMRQSYADMMGLDIDDAGRVFSGESMDAINAERARAAAEEDVINRRRERAMTSITDLILQTQERLLSIRDMFMQIFNQVSESLTPIFGNFYDVSQNILRSFQAWLGSILAHPEFRAMMQDIADYIEEMPTHINEFMPTWEDIRDTAAEIWPVVRSIGEALIAVVSFMAEHPQAVGIGLGILVVASLLSNFASLAVLFSPAGAILVGIALLADGFLAAANNSSTLLDTVREINDIEPELQTDEERAIRRESSDSAFQALSHMEESRGLSVIAPLGGLAADAAGLFGATSTANSIRGGMAVGTSTFGDMEELVRTSLEGGHSVEGVVERIMLAASRGGESAEMMIRRGFGRHIIGGDLEAGVLDRVGEINRSINPSAGGDGSSTPGTETLEPSPPGAIETAPTTTTTATAAPLVASGGGPERETFMAEVLLDGSRVGTATIMRARRSA